MVTPPKLLGCRPGICRRSDSVRCRAERSAHVLGVGLVLGAGIDRLYCRCLIASRKLSIQMRVHHRARRAATKAATHPRQKAVDQEQSPARLQPMPISSPTMAHKIINDFIPDQLFSNPAASSAGNPVFNIYRRFFEETATRAPRGENRPEFFARRQES